MVARTKGGPLKRRMYTRTRTRALAVVVLPDEVGVLVCARVWVPVLTHIDSYQR